MHLLIDNYDSFTYNVVQALGELGAQVRVVRNDAMDCDALEALRPASLIVSPGPGTPDDAGVSLEMIRRSIGVRPVLGICLGHQSIVQACGGRITRADKVMHGKTSHVYHDGRTLYDGLSNPFDATRYHSLLVREEDLPACLEVSAYTSGGEIMGVRHKEHPVEGVQFHPESILTVEGKDLLANYLRRVAGSAAR
ncbi:MAG TPA: aminodeoxychorismate/anthranilate synthase component II [Candidatus Krumholzibacteria bacterium]|nr:aminodeoxychorismate/anthranilate synthase component II [Candidatus Krumholzibacteria bacterium]HRX50274.1 aminodeoxychorismate/anthranilate synthase component II [Candidatus Krumholzibacteria bacterium]